QLDAGQKSTSQRRNGPTLNSPSVLTSPGFPAVAKEMVSTCTPAARPTAQVSTCHRLISPSCRLRSNCAWPDELRCEYGSGPHPSRYDCFGRERNSDVALPKEMAVSARPYSAQPESPSRACNVIPRCGPAATKLLAESLRVYGFSYLDPM